MYYYIMESAGKKTAAWQEKVKDYLGDIGIAGETVSPSSARTIEELTSIGIAKGYTTIVAVGPELIADKVATALINQTEINGFVLGYIPSDFNSLLAKKIGAKDLQTACNALKQRKLEVFDTCQIEPNKYFLTQITVESDEPVDAYVAFESIQAGLIFNKITIDPGLQIKIEDYSEQRGLGQKFFGNLFKKKEERDIYTTSIYPERIKIETLKKSVSVKVDGEVVAKTPISVISHPKALKIIVARDTIANQ